MKILESSREVNIVEEYTILMDNVKYTIWMKIPKLKTGHFSGDFEFVYNDITGRICTQLINLTNIDEGKIIMFPSKLPHCVYPFYNTDELRISISGNILLEN